MPVLSRSRISTALASAISLATFVACGSMQSSLEDNDLQLDSESFAATAASISTTSKSQSGESLCLDAKDQGTASGTKVQLWSCSQSDNQGFRLSGNALKVYDNMCVSVANARNKDGSSVRLKPCDSSKVSQQWKKDGALLRWANTDKCLDVTDGDFANGTLMQIWTCQNGSPHQSFATAGSSSSNNNGGGSSSVKPHGTLVNARNWRQETYAAGTFNQEQQRYTDKNQNVEFKDDGSLIITARKDNNGNWTSARLSGDEVGSLPAYFEATITLPRGRGTWPAFWLTSRGSWPQGGEIDIMEQVNGDGQTHWSNHWGANTGKTTFDTHESMSGLDLSKPHRYGGFITKDGVQFYVDGKPVGKWVTYPAQSNFPRIASQMVPIVNLAMGGMWPGNVPSSTGTQTMIVHAITRASSPPN